MKYILKNKQRVRTGFLNIDRYDIKHERFAGGENLHIIRECMERGDAAVVLLHDPKQDKLLLIEQLRVGPIARQQYPWMLEAIAGIIDAGESPEQCAKRECLEESGYAMDAIEYLGKVFISPGGCSEIMHLFYAQADANTPIHAGGGLANEQEDIRQHWVDRQEVMQWVDQGKIRAAPLLLVLLRTEQMLS
ncbi:MAG: NUDIX domain-containing protein [Mariprofundales bacterium]